MDVLKKRNSNVELVRVIAMFLIILNHLVEYGGAFECSQSLVNRLGATIFICCGKIGVTLFLIVGSYFLVEKKCLIKNIVRTWLVTMVVSMVFYVSMGSGNVITRIFKGGTPILHNAYWFVTVYLALLLLAPLLNFLLRKMSYKECQSTCLIGFCLFVCFPSILMGRDLFCNALFWFLFIYFFVGFAKKYSFFGKRKWGAIVTMLSFSLLVFLVYLDKLFLPLRDMGSFFVLIVSVGLFNCFLTKPLKYNKWVNFVAQGTFVAYLLHDNSLFRLFFWKDLLLCPAWLNSNLFLLYSILSALGVLLIGAVIAFPLNKFVAFLLELNFVKNKLTKLESFLPGYRGL